MFTTASKPYRHFMQEGTIIYIYCEYGYELIVAFASENGQ